MNGSKRVDLLTSASCLLLRCPGSCGRSADHEEPDGDLRGVAAAPLNCWFVANKNFNCRSKFIAKFIDSKIAIQERSFLISVGHGISIFCSSCSFSHRIVSFLTFCSTIGVPKSTPPCRRNPQGVASPLFNLTVCWAIVGSVFLGANDVGTGFGFGFFGDQLNLLGRSLQVTRVCLDKW